MKFNFEWQEAPGVQDKILAATWARFSIKVGDNYATEAIDPKSDSRRTGIYGSLFPLAQWIVEELVAPPVRARSGFAPYPGDAKWPDDQRPWIRRHNLLVAREGEAPTRI